MAKNIYIGSDHRGFKLKLKVEKWLQKNEIPYEDLGNVNYDPKDDYPDYAYKVARRVVRDDTYGILLCGSAQGMAIAANKVKGARAVIPYTVKEAKLSRQDDDANIMCVAANFSKLRGVTRHIEAFLTTSFSEGERHKRRLEKIKHIEEGKFQRKKVNKSKRVDVKDGRVDIVEDIHEVEIPDGTDAPEDEE
jgi:ribose 5-phosphate isomerase B